MNYLYLQIRKKDSVTSILLFFFNVFLLERGINSLPLKKILKMLQPFQKSETAVRMGLSRGVQNRLLVNTKKGGEVFYGITDEAAQGLKHWHTTLLELSDKTRQQLAQWDGEWSIICLLGSSGQKEDSNFTHSLRLFGYGKLGSTFFISPYDLTIKVADYARQHGVKNYYQFRG
ncbi:MAG: hypothetical protein ACYDEQ_15240, partial [Desulfocucumaceae bacterium]